MNLQKKEKFCRVFIMQIDYALILSAGLGTRMGEIGKKIPKVLWPIYFKSMLELQILYCEELGVKKIFINTHYLHDEIELYLKTHNLFKKVTLLHEDPLLDSGGAIHNLAARSDVNYQGNLLLVNGDQFLFFSKKFWEEALAKLKESRAVLFGIKVDKNSNYNETILKADRLVEIKKNIDKDHDYITYSGLGLLNLNGLVPVSGISRFFETVANYKKEKIEFITPDKFEYWDFGTAEIYARNIFKLAAREQRESLMGKFLIKSNTFSDDDKLFCDVNNLSIDLDCSGKLGQNSIHTKGLFQKL